MSKFTRLVFIGIYGCRLNNDFKRRYIKKIICTEYSIDFDVNYISL